MQEYKIRKEIKLATTELYTKNKIKHKYKKTLKDNLIKSIREKHSQNNIITTYTGKEWADVDITNFKWWVIDDSSPVTKQEQIAGNLGFLPTDISHRLHDLGLTKDIRERFIISYYSPSTHHRQDLAQKMPCSLQQTPHTPSTKIHKTTPHKNTSTHYTKHTHKNPIQANL